MALREAFHISLASAFIFGIYYDLFVLPLPDVIRVRHEKSAGRLKYLTFWNLLLQAFFFTLSFVNDIFGTRTEDPKKRGQLQKFLDFIFITLGFPVSIFVCSSFWTLFTINRELVFPRIFDTFFPSWLNHIMHTLIFPAVAIEMISIKHQTPNRKQGLAVLSLFTLIYLIWTFIIAYVFEFWTYPVLEVLNWWQRTAFCIVCSLFIQVYYFLGEAIYHFVWGCSSGKPEKGKKKNQPNKKQKSK